MRSLTMARTSTVQGRCCVPRLITADLPLCCCPQLAFEKTRVGTLYLAAKGEPDPCFCTIGSPVHIVLPGDKRYKPLFTTYAHELARQPRHVGKRSTIRWFLSLDAATACAEHPCKCPDPGFTKRRG
jgi:hypothetical protein